MTKQPFIISAIDHVVLNVNDVEASAGWYASVLGMTRAESHTNGAIRVSLHFGAQKINLRPASESTERWFTGDIVAPGSADLCFITDAAPELVVAHLERLGIAVERGPVERNGARGAMISVYCRDPDGNLIEIARYLSSSENT
ncbi:MAG TPA: VOC family protein [Candidatus Acidoferrales bacterium]|nr:VOC family protein [Candidatus Acidoferrales bacterium]